MYNLRYRRIVTGAVPGLAHVTCPLDEVIEALPPEVRDEPRNAVYLLDAVTDGFCVIDVERSCPPKIREHLLRMPWVYGEVSMSEKGYHLVMPLPDDVDSWPDALATTALKEAHGWFEILISHWVTFTGEIILPRDADEDWNALWTHMASGARRRSSARVNIDDANLDKANAEVVRATVATVARRGGKDAKYPLNTPANYDYDMSRYDYYMLGVLLRTVDRKFERDLREHPDDTTRGVTVCAAARELMRQYPDIWESREKHGNLIHGIPLLLWESLKIAAESPSGETRRPTNDEEVVQK